MNPDQTQNAGQELNQPIETPKKLSFFQSLWKTKKFLIIGAVLILIIILAGVLSYFLYEQSKPKTYTLTSKDIDKTITLKKNDVVSINEKAPTSLDLIAQVSNPSVVEVIKTYDPKTGQFSEKIIPKTKGEADVEVVGSPPCKGHFCLPIIVTISRNHIIVN